MKYSTENRLFLIDLLPKFVSELKQLLEEQGEPELAAQVPGLLVLDRCRCKDEICATFYTQTRPEGGYGSGHRNVRLMPNEGTLLILDVVDGQIMCVEVLDREDVREKLDAVIP